MTPELIWPCAGCHQPVEACLGHLGVNTAATDRTTTALQQWFAHPATWTAHHHDCCPGTCGYTIAINDVTTNRGLLRWTTLLQAKPWQAATDWNQLLREAVHGHGRVRHPAHHQTREAS